MGLQVTRRIRNRSRQPRRERDSIPQLLHLILLVGAVAFSSQSPPLLASSHRHNPSLQTCGSWQHNYTQLHRTIRELPPGNPNRRFLIFQCEVGRCGGIGDFFIGLVSAFVVCLVQDRALLIDFENMEQAFQSPYIDWRLTDDVATANEEVTAVNLYNKDVPADLEERIDALSATRNLRVQWNRGILVETFSTAEGRWRRVLEEKGLTLPFSFGCILRFLVSPSPAVLQLADSTLKEMRQPNSATVCIHIRTTDRSTWQVAMVGEDKKPWKENLDAELRRAQRLLSCAEKVEGFWFSSSIAVRWLLMSSSKKLKEAVAEAYGNKVLTTDIVPVHTELQGDASVRVNAFLSTAAEWFLFSECDKFVFTESGFSKTAALFSLKPMSMYMLGRYADTWRVPDWKDECDPEQPTKMSVLGNNTRWSGI